MDEAPLRSSQEILEELQHIYQRYLEESEALFRKETGFLNAIRSVLGTNTIKNSAIHRKFYEAVGACVDELATGLEQTPDPSLADQAARLLLEERPKGQDLTRYSWLSAAQTLAIPLLPYVTRPTLEALRADYCAAHRSRDRLPKQMELVEQMDRLLQQ